MATTMKKAVIVAPGRVEIAEAPVPVPGPHQVLVRVKACGICTMDQRLFTGRDQTGLYPMLAGHEVAGIVESVGPGVLAKVVPGDHVSLGLDNLNRCHQCEACRRGYDNLCDSVLWLNRSGGEPVGPGGFAEYLVADGHRIFRVADDLAFAEAALAEPLACVLRSVRKAQIRPGDVVVIVGAGTMGLLHLMLAKRALATVVISEIIPARAAKARDLGADFVVDPAHEDFAARIQEITSGHGADVTFVAVGLASVVEDAVRVAAKAGRVHCFASVHPRGTTVSLDPNLFHGREITLTGTVGQDHEDMLRSVALLSSKALDLKPLITKVYPLQQATRAFEHTIKPDSYRVVLMM
ncbi:MAG: alcohol dehydrogenase catalytic domain-containing protein [Chloroflexi bacterium]|nr:alcohol dehydrogenase catalytic domain-containing protein [Chloroflexota bacterium]